VLRKRSARFAVGLLSTAVLVAFYVLVLNVKVYGQMKDQKQWKHPQAFAALAYHGSPLYCLAAAAIILSVGLHTGPVSAIFSAILRSKLFSHLAKVSFVDNVHIENCSVCKFHSVYVVL
jgi:Mn2+/Fe2+ NRAMP family transporter